MPGYRALGRLKNYRSIDCSINLKYNFRFTGVKSFDTIPKNCMQKNMARMSHITILKIFLNANYLPLPCDQLLAFLKPL